ncbi:MAG: hypothetical protein ACI4VH_04665 [Clostridia bacterium]
MKKTIKILIMMLIALIALLNVKTFAADDKLAIQSVEITAPEDGVYGIGQEITITFTFNKPIKGTLPKYSIYFNTSSSETIELNEVALTNFSTEAVYKYTIKSGDNGELKPGNFVNPSNYQIEDENGTKYYLSSPYITKFTTKILADTTIKWTDFEKAEVKMESEDSGNYNVFNVKVQNCNLNSDNSYYVHLSHKAEENVKVKNMDDIYNNFGSEGNKIWQTTLNPLNYNVNLNSEFKNLLAEAEDVYVTICELDNTTNTPRIVLNSKKIERLSHLPLTQRITAYFFNDCTSTFCWEPHGEEIERKVNYKIGKVTDVALLQSLKNGDANALTKLMEYAKKADTIGTGTLKLGEDKTITDKLDLVDDEYYYVYLEIDTENGKYREIEDVSLYQALVSDSVGKELHSMVDKNFHWNIDGEVSSPKEDTTIAKFSKLPNTGISLVVVITALGFSIVSIILFKKYKFYKKIK